MRYFMCIILAPGQENTAPPQALQEAMGPYMEKYITSGALISTAGLKRSSVGGARIVARGGSTSTRDGPFAEAKEVVGGYAVMELPDHAAALDMAREFVQLHIDNGWPDITIEIREIDGGFNY